MYLVFYLQVCFVLVSSNPLYEFNCCPNSYHSYGNEQPLVVQRSNYNPYPLSLLDHNSCNPNSQCQYLNSVNFVPNYPFYNQNGLDNHQQFPETETQKVINNYILIPQEYFQNNAIEDESVKKTIDGTNIKNVILNNKKNKKKKRRQNMSTKINNGIADISIPETKITKQKMSKEETDSTKDGQKKSKKKLNKDDYNLLTTNVEETLPLKKGKNHVEALTKNTNNHLISSCGKKTMGTNASPSNKPHYQEPKQTKGSPKKEVVKEYVQDVNIDPKKKEDTGFADVNFCFDINEDCTDLGCRHTRNKDVNKKIKSQSPKPQQDFSNNLNNYMNSLTYNQQMNPNFFNPNINFPLNFDHLYQTPQTSNGKPKESNNRRSNKKRKPPSPNRQTSSNKKKKTSITIVDNCDKVVELTPEMPNIDTTTVATKTITNSEEPTPKNIVLEEIALDKDQDSNLEIPILTNTETLITEVLKNDETSNNKNVPFENYNDVMDEYYPDFTLDNRYISSKEDYDFGNFHDRYYYTYEDKPELNRERRKYEHSNDNKLKSYIKLDRSNENKNILQEPTEIQEIIFKTDTSKEKVNFLTPSELEFPGFKTEMINKEKYFAKEEHPRSNNYDMNEITTNKMCASSKNAVDKENQHTNNVEMIFANSKVVRYGVPEKKENVISKVPEPEIKKELKNLISNDGKTTFVIAKSLGYTY